MLSPFFVGMVWSSWKTFNVMVGPCSPKNGQVSFTVLKNFFVWMLCSRLKVFQFMARPRSPTSPVTSQLISRRWKIFSSWYNVDCQQCPNEQLVVLPQTRSSSFHGVEYISRLDDVKLFKNIQIDGWAVLPQARPSPFHGVEESFRLLLSRLSTTFNWTAGRAPPNTIQLISRVEGSVRLDDMKLFKNDQISGWAVFPYTRPSAFHIVKKLFCLDVMQPF